MENKRTNNIEELKRKNRRKVIKANIEGSIVSMSTVSFKEFKENDDFVKSVFKKIIDIEVMGILPISSLEQLKSDALDLMNSNIPLMSSDTHFNIFHFGKYEIESINIQSLKVLSNYSELLDIIGYSDGRADLVIVSNDLEKGFVIERTEYKYEVRVWGF